MANIQTELNRFKTSVYGEEIRDSLISSITAINQESENSKAVSQQATSDVDATCKEIAATKKIVEAAVVNANGQAAAANTAAQAANAAATSANTAKAGAQAAATAANNAASAATQAATGANTVKNDLITKRDSGFFNGPKGDKGDPAATIRVGKVETGPAGTLAKVLNAGTTSNVILDFTIPQGVPGTGGGGGGMSLIFEGKTDVYRSTMHGIYHIVAKITPQADGNKIFPGELHFMVNAHHMQPFCLPEDAGEGLDALRMTIGSVNIVPTELMDTAILMAMYVPEDVMASDGTISIPRGYHFIVSSLDDYSSNVGPYSYTIERVYWMEVSE